MGFSEQYTNLGKELDLRKTAVVVVDMMNDFCKPGGIMYLEEGKVVVAPIQRLVTAARAHRIPVIWVQQRYRVDKYDKVTEKRKGTCYEGSWGGRQIDELPVEPEDYIVYKRRYSGFFQTDLDLTLRDMGAEKVIIVGTVTNICVRGTVADAFQLDYEVYMPTDGVKATDERAEAAHLWDIETHFGTLTTVDELVAAMDGLQPEDVCRMR